MTYARLFGLIAVIFYAFALVTYVVLAVDDFHLTTIHLALGSIATLVFLWLGGRSLFQSHVHGHGSGPTLGRAIYMVLFVVAIALVNVLARTHELFWIDTTEKKIHSLAPQTLELLDRLQKPLFARAFFVGGRLNGDLEQLLDRMAKASPMFRWSRIDPEQQEQLAQTCKIARAGSVHLELDSGPHPCSGRGNVLDRDISEQTIVNALVKLTQSQSRTVHFLEGHEEPRLSDQGPTGYSRLQVAVEAEGLATDALVLGNKAAVPEAVQTIVIAAPKRPLLDSEKLALKGFLERGGSMIVLHERGLGADVAELLTPYGLVASNDLIVDKEELPFEGASLAVEPIIRSYGKHRIVRNFEEPMRLSTACSVEHAVPKYPGKVTDLAYTSETSWAERDVELLLGENAAAALDPSDKAGPVSIAAAYEAAPAKEKKSGETRIVLIGDADFVSNINLGQYFNRDFFLNSLNWAVGEEQGITIRSSTLRESKRLLSQEQFSKLFVLSGILYPECILLLGCALWWSRRR